MEKKSALGRAVALDVGDVWTGVAVSDETRSIARPVEVVESGELSAFLGELGRGGRISEVVVGVPRTLSGEVGFQARKILDKLDGLRDEFPEMRFVEWDERFTSRMAVEGVGAGRAKKPKRTGARKSGANRAEGRVDHLAAARMLQEYLESRGET
jgi:putative holliday junction resolvase